MLNEVTIITVIEHLSEGEIDRFNQEEIKTRIKNIFELNDVEVNKVYRIWKHQYLNKVNEQVLMLNAFI